MSKAYLFLGGPAHGKFRQVEGLKNPVICAELVPPAWVHTEPPFDGALMTETKRTTYRSRQLGLVQAPDLHRYPNRPVARYLKSVFVPEHWSAEDAESVLKQYLLDQWIQNDPDSRELS